MAREAIEEAGYIPKIVELLNVSQSRYIAIVLLYLLSLDDKIRVTFAFTDCVRIVRNKIFNIKFLIF